MLVQTRLFPANSVRSDLLATVSAGCANLLDLFGRCEGRHRSDASLQLPPLCSRRLFGEVAATVCRLQVALQVGVRPRRMA